MVPDAPLQDLSHGGFMMSVQNFNCCLVWVVVPVGQTLVPGPP